MEDNVIEKAKPAHGADIKENEKKGEKENA